MSTFAIDRLWVFFGQPSAGLPSAYYLSILLHCELQRNAASCMLPPRGPSRIPNKAAKPGLASWATATSTTLPSKSVSKRPNSSRRCDPTTRNTPNVQMINERSARSLLLCGYFTFSCSSSSLSLSLSLSLGTLLPFRAAETEARRAYPDDPDQKYELIF
jgi:hypothetical protein